MADRPKKKQISGQRNDERPCGKAPKKHIKTPKVKNLTDELRAERDRKAAERRVAADKARMREELEAERIQKARMAGLHRQAIILDRAFNDARRREMSKPAADAIKRMVGAK